MCQITTPWENCSGKPKTRLKVLGGKTLPAGFIDCGWAKTSNAALKQLAFCFFLGKTQRLSDWSDPFV